MAAREHPKRPSTGKASETKHLSTVPDGNQVRELAKELKRVSQTNVVSSTVPKRVTTINQRRQFDDFLSSLATPPNGVKHFLDLFSEEESNLANFLFILDEQNHLDRFLTQLEDYPTGYKQWVAFLEESASWMYFKNLLTKRKYLPSTTSNPIKFKIQNADLDFKPEPRVSGKDKRTKEPTMTQKADVGDDNASRELDGCLTPETFVADEGDDDNYAPSYGWLSTKAGTTPISEAAMNGSRPASGIATPSSLILPYANSFNTLVETTLDALVGSIEENRQHTQVDDAASGEAVRFSRPASAALTPRSEAFAPLGGTDVPGWMHGFGENRGGSNRAMGASRPASGTATPEYVHFNQPSTSLDNLLSPTFASTTAGGMSINANGGSRPASGTATPYDYQGGGFFEPTRNNPKGVNHNVTVNNAQGTYAGIRGGQNPGASGNTRRSRRSRRSRKDKKDDKEGGAGGGGGYFQGMKNMFGGGGQKTEKNQDATPNSAGSAEPSAANKHQMKNQGLRGNMNARALKVDQK